MGFPENPDRSPSPVGPILATIMAAFTIWSESNITSDSSFNFVSLPFIALAKAFTDKTRTRTGAD